MKKLFLVNAFLLLSFGTIEQTFVLQPAIIISVVDSDPLNALNCSPDIFKTNDFTFKEQVTGPNPAFSIEETFFEFDLSRLITGPDSAFSLEEAFLEFDLSRLTKQNQEIGNLNYFYSDYDDYRRKIDSDTIEFSLFDQVILIIFLLLFLFMILIDCTFLAFWDILVFFIFVVFVYIILF